MYDSPVHWARTMMWKGRGESDREISQTPSPFVPTLLNELFYPFVHSP